MQVLHSVYLPRVLIFFVVTSNIALIYRDKRLQMATFTLPLLYDKTYLVIPRPGSADTLNDQIVKVLSPFTFGLWIFVLSIIVAAALFSTWFTHETTTIRIRSEREIDQPTYGRRRKMKAYLRLALDSFLEKGIVSFMP
jgi:hypothetical protein